MQCEDIDKEGRVHTGTFKLIMPEMKVGVDPDTANPNIALSY